jgi:antitoxin ParD1/3/4
MLTRNVLLTEQREIFVVRLVETGRYRNASEVLLRLLEDRVQQREAQLKDIRAGVIDGFDQVERGEHAEEAGEEVSERVFKRALRKHGR